MFIELNIIFYIFIFLFIFYIILIKNIRKPFIKNDYFIIEFIKELDFYYAHNKIFTFFAGILYFIFSILIFFILRIEMIGSSKNIKIFAGFLQLKTISNLILFLFCVMLYLNILSILFYPYILRLHYYLNQYNWYSSLNEWGLYHNMLISDLLGKIFFFLHVKKKGLLNKKDNSFLIKIFYKIMIKVINKLHTYMSRVVYYFPYSLVVIAFIIDLYNNMLYYIYYALLYFFITNFIKKIRKFYNENDYGYDSKITSYFYKNEIPYEKAYNSITTSDPRSFMSAYPVSKQAGDIVSTREEIIYYFQNDRKVDYILDPDRKLASIQLFSKAKRINVLLLLFLANIYFVYNYKKYNIHLLNMGYEIQPIYLIIPLLLLTLIFEIKILYEIENALFHGGEHKIYKIAFIFLVIIQAIFILYLILKNNLITYPTEIIFQCDYITITETFTKDEKIKYTIRYIDILMSDSQNILQSKILLKEKMITLIEKSDLTLEELRKIVKFNIKINND